MPRVKNTDDQQNVYRDPTTNKIAFVGTPDQATTRLGGGYSTIDVLSRKKQWMLEFMHLPTRERIWFHGFITQFGDSFNSDWHDEDVFGRMDPISIYKGTKRTMTLSFGIPAVSVQEAKNNVYTINRLVQFLYPMYEKATFANNARGMNLRNLSVQEKLRVINKLTDAASSNAGKTNYIVSPPLLRMRFTNLIHNSETNQQSSVMNGGLVVKVNGNLNIEPILSDGSFGTEPGMIYPKGWSVSMNLTVFHTHTLGWHNSEKSKGITFSDNIGLDGRQIDQNFPYGILGNPGV